MSKTDQNSLDLDHVFILDDDRMVLEALERSVHSAGISCTAFNDVDQCLAELSSKYCTVLITDLKMPKLTGIELVSKLQKTHPKLPIIVMTGYADVPTAVKAIQCGAKEFIEKPFEEELFLQLINKYAVVNKLKLAKEKIDLTESELAIVKLIAEGKCNKEIAFVLSKSIRTIENQRQKLYRKLQVQGTADLVRKSIELGLISL
jgi:two-component system response regulator FixJ